MSEFKNILKKSLSIFLVIVMCLSVFPVLRTSLPEADAATAGTYDVKVNINVTDECDGWGDGTYHPHSNISIYCKGNNGFGADEYYFITDAEGSLFSSTGTRTYTKTGVGFPTVFHHDYEYGGGFTWRTLAYTLTIDVAKHGSNNYRQVYSNSHSNKSAAFKSASANFNWNISDRPHVARIDWDTSKLNITVPKSGSASVSTSAATVYDDYGVEWYQEPTYWDSVGGYNNNTASGITIPKGAANTTSVTVTNAAKDWIGKNNAYKELYIQAGFQGGLWSEKKYVRINNVGYNVIFKNYDGTVIEQKTWNYGSTPTCSKTPTRASTAEYTYKFTGWSPAVTMANGDIVYTAQFRATKNKYNITFINGDGSVLQSSPIEYGTKPSCGKTPVKATTAKYTYTFDGWKLNNSGTVYKANELPVVNGAATYYASFTPNIRSYEIIFKNEDGTVLKRYNVNYDEMPSYSGTPVKAATAQYTYTFNGWDKPISKVTGPATYTATYKATVNQYKVRFEDYDGRLIKEQTVNYGSAASAPAHPNDKPYDNGYHYTPNGWDKAFNNVTGNITVRALYNKVAHNFVEYKRDPATCTQDGKIYKRCTCGKEITEVIKAKHTLTAIAAVEPTCTTAGNNLYYKCSVCGLYFVDATAKTQTTPAAQVRPALGHNWSDWTTVTKATCTTKGQEKRVCSRNNNHVEYRDVPALGHTMIKIEAVPATCLLTGNNEYYKCRVCGKYYKDINGNTETTPEKEVTEAIGHNWGPWETVEAPSCLIPGRERRVCLNDPHHVENREMPAIGHNIVFVPAAPPSCEKEGWYDHYRCENCRLYYSDPDGNHQLSHSEIFIPAEGHEWGEWTVDILPTCTQKGKEVRTCKKDAEHKEYRDIPATGHNIIKIDAVPATCTEKGNLEYYKCTNCKLIYKDINGTTETTLAEVTTPALGHNWGEWTEDVPATCTEKGKEVRVCLNNPEHKDYRAIPALGHTAIEIPAKDPTCTEKGNNKYYQCDRCKLYFEDAACTVPTTPAQQEIPALGHAEGAPVVKNEVAPTCTKDGSYENVYNCAVCGTELRRETVVVPALGHNLIKIDAIPATCTENGRYEYYKCDRCGLYYKDAEGLNPTTPEAEVEPATGHNWGEWTVDVPATCTEKGKEVRECLNNPAHKDYRDISALGHTATEIPAKAATCTEKGNNKYYQCDTCKLYFEDEACTVPTTPAQQEIPALGHTEGAPVVKNEVAPTCTKDGSYENVYSCAVCGTELRRETVTVPALGHNLIKIDAIPATCTENGRYEYYKCDRCGLYYKDSEGLNPTTPEAEVEPATGHNWGEWTADVPATCTEKGKEVRVCLNNPEHKDYRDIPALGHTAIEIPAKDPTCTEKGNNKYYQCDTCKLYFEDAACTVPTTPAQQEIPALGHTEGAPAVKNEVAPTCTKDGSYENVYSCAVCGTELRRETVTVPALGHNLIKIDAIPVNCTCKGSNEYYKCDRCGLYFKDAEGTVPTTPEAEKVPALGHNWGEWTVDVPATCTERGKEVRECLNNPEHKDYRDIPALGHTAIEIPAKDPTCTEKGNNKYYQCDTCKLYFEDAACTVPTTPAQQEIPALGHTEGAPVVKNEVAPTCTEDGSYENVYSCAVCGTELRRETVAVPALGHNLTEIPAAEPTCEKDGTKGYWYCDRCQHCYEDKDAAILTTAQARKIPALGHIWGEWTIDVLPTCTQKGKEVRVCLRDGTHFDYRDIDALGHTLIKIDAIPATCTCKGSNEYYKCETCGLYFKDAEGTVPTTPEDEKVPATGHNWGEWTVDVPASCTEKGKEVRVCANNPAHKEYRDIPELGHNLIKIDAVAPTCTEKGNNEYYQCSVCKLYFKDAAAQTETTADAETLRATGHNWGEWTVVTAPGCLTKGKEKRVCANDPSHVEWRVLDALGHDMIKIEAKAPTCTEKGNNEYYKCARCGKYYKQAGGCTETTPQAEEIAIKHTPAVAVKENEKAPSCITEGSYDEVVYCSICNTELSRKTVSVPALGHNWGDWVISDEESSVNTVIMKRVCARCGAVEKKETEYEGNANIKINANDIYTNGRILKGITAYYIPSGNPIENPTWSSSNESIVKVRNNKLYAVGIGLVTITATDGKIKASKQIRVNNDEDLRCATFINVDGVKYIVEDFYTIYNTETFYWSSREDIHFKVDTHIGYDFNSYAVNINGKPVFADENGYYVIPAGESHVRITITPTEVDENNNEVPFWELFINFFKNIIAFFTKMFG